MKWLLALVMVAEAQTVPDALLGRWRSAETSKGGIGSFLEFRDGGVLRSGVGAIVADGWRTEGQELVDTAGKRVTWDLREAGVLRLWQGQRMVSEWKRVGEAGEGLVGEWSGKQQMEGFLLNPRWIFYARGQNLFVMPFRWKTGRWKVTGETMDVTWASGERSLGRWKVQGNVLEIPGTAEKPMLRFYRY